MNLEGKTLPELKEYFNSLSNEELDKAVAEVDLKDFDLDLEVLDLLTSSRLYDYIQYTHGGNARVEL